MSQRVTSLQNKAQALEFFLLTLINDLYVPSGEPVFCQGPQIFTPKQASRTSELQPGQQTVINQHEMA